jgi:UDP-glucose 4-epimerase
VRLPILGDGSQSKSYIHVDDVIDAVLTAAQKTEQPYRVYNVATGDYITVTEIAELAAECVDLDPEQVEFDYSGGDRGWKGDVPVVRVDTSRIRALGWQNTMGSREALRESMLAMLPEARAGRL